MPTPRRPRRQQPQPLTEAGPRRPHKYHASPRDQQGLTREQAEALGLKWTKFYDSTKEATRHWELQRLEQEGRIRGLQWQPRFRIEINGMLICTYVADACYEESGQVIVEDTKGGNYRTDVYRIKAKLMKAVLGITIREV